MSDKLSNILKSNPSEARLYDQTIAREIEALATAEWQKRIPKTKWRSEIESKRS
jgi:hypothetical protein